MIVRRRVALLACTCALLLLLPEAGAAARGRVAKIRVRTAPVRTRPPVRRTRLTRPAATPRAFARQLARSGGRVLIALDIDGVLAPIVKQPGRARIPKKTRDALRRLAAIPGVELAFITGRDADSAEKMLGDLPGWRAVGHGLLVYRGGQPVPTPSVTGEQEKALATFRGWIGAQLPPEVRVEHKPTSTALHFRELDARSPAEASRLFERARRAASGHPGLTVRDGRQVLEVGVLGHKDQALLHIAGATGAQAIAFAGDDVTDEPAIQAAAGAGGLGLYVRSRERPGAPAGASGTLAGTRGVQRWLSALADELATR